VSQLCAAGKLCAAEVHWDVHAETTDLLCLHPNLMSAKRRKPKRKSKQRSKPVQQVVMESPRKPLASPAEISVENSAVPAEIREETENPASAEMHVEREAAASSVEVQDELENSAVPAEIREETENPASAEMHVEREATASPVEIQDELENFASAVEIREETKNPPRAVEKSPDTDQAAAERATVSAADRRSHPRYAFVASVEVVAAERGARIKTRVRDLSQQGCYVDTESPFDLGTVTDVRITKGANSFEGCARVVFNQPGKGMGLMFTAVAPEQLGTLATWIAESRETSWLATNRRRSQRVLMKVPVRVSGQSGAASTFEEDTHTLAISAHGALLAVMAPVYRGQRFTLSNVQTKAAVECVVAHIDKLQGEQIQVGVEFLLPNPTFWRVAFPPKDWTPSHPDAKSG
jgi:PilZ domain